MYRIFNFFMVVFLFSMGCSKLPCKLPSYYGPDPGASYTAEDVRVKTKEGFCLAGTLTIPSDISSPYPAVVLITGSRPSDRDLVGSMEEPLKSYRPFFQIADALSAKGIAVLRMDDRGYACSKGGDINDATIPERAEDIKAGLEYLRGCKVIDGGRLGLLGISEGGNIGPMIAASDPTIKALVILAGSATSGREILYWQKRYDTALIEGISDQERNRILKQRLIDIDKWMDEAEVHSWRKSFVEYNPLPTAKNVSCPVLILHGDRDSQVPVEHAQILADAMKASGNEDVTVKILKNHNHLFLEDTDGRYTDNRYLELLYNKNKLSQHVLRLISDWFSSRLKP